MNIDQLICREHDNDSVKSSTTYTNQSQCITPPPPPLHLSRRSSSASDDSASSSGGSYTAITTPAAGQFKLPPNFQAANASSGSISDLAHVASAVASAHDDSPCHSPRYQPKMMPSDAYDFSSRRSNSFDAKSYSPNVYAPLPPAYSHSYLPSEPYPAFRRERAQSTPMGYPTASSYSPSHPSYFSPSLPVTHTPSVFRGNPVGYYSSPSTAQDRRKAHILSEQKRRESINDGFQELKQRLMSDLVTRALSTAANSSSEFDSDARLAFDSNAFLGGGNRESKAASLRKAVKALDCLAEKVIVLTADNTRLRQNLQGRRSKNAKRGSKDVTTEIDLTMQDEAMKIEDTS